MSAPRAPFPGTTPAPVIAPPPRMRPPISNAQIPGANLIVAGCHGGAGTTTVCRLLTGVARPLDAGTLRGHTGPAHLLLVAQGNHNGSHAAIDALNLANRMLILPLAIVVMGDSRLPTPRSVKNRFHLMVPRLRAGIIEFPYVPRWRYEGISPQTPLPSNAKKALDSLLQLVAASLRH